MSNEWDKIVTQNIEMLKKLREPFLPHQISKLPKGTKAQNECPPSEKKSCSECGGWHHPKIIHLDYVGHAALTDRLLDTDPAWYWEPLAFKDGLPAFDESGGLWIKLTVCGVTRLGYGNAAGKSYMDVGAREKEVIGDALRNAAMRFGAALDLWHKGDLHIEEETKKKAKDPIMPGSELSNEEAQIAQESAAAIIRLCGEGKELAAYEELYEQGFSNEVFLAVWGLLRPHSQIRTMLKKMREENK